MSHTSPRPTWRRLVLPAALLLSCMHGAAAHHGATVYDRTNPITVEGTVREFRWTSPHAWILLDVPTGAAMGTAPAAAPAAAGASAAAGSQQWAFEGAAISTMVRNGWKSSTLHPGDRVRVLAAPRRDGTHGGEFLSVTLGESGRTLQTGVP